MKGKSKFIIGAIERIDLPELGISNLSARIDTGAKTSSLHVDNIKEFSKDDKNWVSFDIHPDIHNVEKVHHATVRLRGKKMVKSSSADKEKRVVIKTPMRIKDQEWLIRLTLTDRTEMNYLMLLGREAMADKILVDPSVEYLITK